MSAKPSPSMSPPPDTARAAWSPGIDAFLPVEPLILTTDAEEPAELTEKLSALQAQFETALEKGPSKFLESARSKLNSVKKEK